MMMIVAAFFVVIAGVVTLWLIDGLYGGNHSIFMRNEDLYRMSIFLNLSCLIFLWLLIYIQSRRIEEHEKFIDKKWGFDEW